jgi:hypothetical protein|tara:strand:+ start:5830 stop:6249 length:420 start_codon:yes stop_codon:yes gene_type:complete
MATRELSSSVKVVHGLDLIQITTNVNSDGTAVDTQGFNSVTAMIHCATSGAYTNGTYTISVLEGDTSGGSFDVTDSSQLVIQDGTDAIEADNENAWCGYVGIKRWVKIRIASTGSSGAGAFLGGNILLGHPHNAPVTAN